MTSVTAGEVRAAMIAKHVQVVDHHECSLCGYMTRYVRHGEKLFFDGACNCVYEDMRPSSFDEAAEWINMQSKPDVRDRIARLFGIGPSQ